MLGGWAFAVAMSLAPDPVAALVFANDEMQPTEERPPDFPYWDSVVQRRYDAPSAVYLGNGWAITARHVGHGELLFGEEIVRPIPRNRHTLLNPNGSTADALVFELAEKPGPPDLPILPIAKRPPAVGDEVVLIGFGRVRESQLNGGDSESRSAIFKWTEKGEKRWGTNRVEAVDHWLHQRSWTTKTFAMTFTPQDAPSATQHEASAAEGDSGGAVFARIDGEWALAGLMISVASRPNKPLRSTMYGDSSFAADFSAYREEILRWTRPQCSNESDDDGDGHVDHPNDPDCQDAADDRERAEGGFMGLVHRGDAAWLGLAALLTIALAYRLYDQRLARQRGRNTPDSTSPSSAE